MLLGQADRASYQLTEALSLWNGEAFEELEEWEPGKRESRRLQELRLEAEELRVDALLRTGRHSEVLAEVQALVRAAPFREHRWVLQARAQYQAGQQGEALRTLHQLKAVLTTKLGVDPGPDVVALEQAILRQDPSLLSGGPVAPSSSTCPYQGLQAFDIDDADRFFGRQGDVDACLEVLRRTSLLALVGPSGSGKSSLMRAGVGAALRSRGTPTVAITPGARPLEALTVLAGAALDLSPDDRTVATIDAFHRVQVLDARTGRLLAEGEAGAAREDPGPRSLEFSPDGRMLAVGMTALSPRPVALLDAQNLMEVGPRLGGLPRAAWRAADVAFSEDGRSLVAALEKLTRGEDALEVTSVWAVVWRLGRSSPPDMLRLSDVGRPSVALSPDGNRLYVLPDRVVHDLGTGERSTFFPRPLGYPSTVDVSPDGKDPPGSGTWRPAGRWPTSTSRAGFRKQSTSTRPDARS